ncbi:hypothetical protein LTR86_009592 [Recurvomyces mirabilis]|nr:hypothetical protein LTR86_009592 [Recurvomyces mirabilis]
MTRKMTPCLPKPSDMTPDNQNEHRNCSSDDETHESPPTRSRSTFGSGTRLSDSDLDLMIKHGLYRDEIPAFKAILNERWSTATTRPHADSDTDQSAEDLAVVRPARMRMPTGRNSTSTMSTSALPLGGMPVRHNSRGQAHMPMPRMDMPSSIFGPGYMGPYPDDVTPSPMPMLAQHMYIAYPPGLETSTGAPPWPPVASLRDLAPIGLERPFSDVRLNITDPITDERYAVYLDSAMLYRRCPFLKHHDQRYRNSLGREVTYHNALQVEWKANAGSQGNRWQISFEAPQAAATVCLQYAASGIMLPPVDLHDIFDTLVMASSWQMDELALATYCHFIQEAMQLPCTRVAVNKAVALRATEVLAVPRLLEMLTTMSEGAVLRFTKILAVQLERSRRSANAHMLQRTWRPTGLMKVDDATITLFEEVSSKASLGTLGGGPGSVTIASRHSWETAEAVPWRIEQGDDSTRAPASVMKMPSSNSSRPGASRRESYTSGDARANTTASSSRFARNRLRSSTSGLGRPHRSASNHGKNDNENESDYDHDPLGNGFHQGLGQRSSHSDRDWRISEARVYGDPNRYGRGLKS